MTSWSHRRKQYNRKINLIWRLWDKGYYFGIGPPALQVANTGFLGRRVLACSLYICCVYFILCLDDAAVTECSCDFRISSECSVLKPREFLWRRIV